MAQKKRSVKFGFIFWISFILLVLLLFLINRNTIQAVLNDTPLPSFFSKKEKKLDSDLQQQIQTEIERINQDEQPSTIEAETEVAIPNNSIQVSSDTTTTSNSVPTTDTQNTPKTETKDEKKQATSTKEEKSTKPATEDKIAEKQTKDVNIYFVQIDSDGKIFRVPSTRNLHVSDSPMSDALKSLFSGTSDADKKKSLRTLIPEGTKLLGATVRDGIAYINVSENFEFNQYGIEGYLAELAQVVYTATEFSTVNSVQFLIEGQKKNYLGSDGIWIGSPLTRESF